MESNTRDTGAVLSEETVRAITEGTAAVTGGEFFRSLVRHLARALGVRYSFAAECTNESKSAARMLAFWAGNAFAEDISYGLDGTPCERVVTGEICCFPDKLQALFPRDRGLVDLQAESYLGLPLLASSGDVLGHLVVMDEKPMHNMQRHLPILQIFAARAGAELERKRAEEAQKKSEERLRTLLDINNAIVTKLTRDDLFAAIADVLGRVIPFDRLSLSLYDPEANVLRLVTYAGPYRRDDYSPIGRILELTDSPVGLAFSTQRPVVRSDLEAERHTTSEERAFGHGFRSMCSLPLIVRGNSIGGITLGSLEKKQYTDEDTQFLMEIANQPSGHRRR
jgi:GAF domain-containing protein